MSDDEIARRKALTFEQAEGLAPPPRQLARSEMSNELRAVLWNFVHGQIQGCVHNGHVDPEPWFSVLEAVHVYKYHLPIDEFQSRATSVMETVKHVIMNGSHAEVYSWLQFVMQHLRDAAFSNRIDGILSYCRAPYRVVEGFVIFPVASEQDAVTLNAAFNELHKSGLTGARKHLKSAAAHLTNGLFADSVRESIHAIESVAKVMEPSADLSKTLAKLENSAKIHGGLKKGFLSIYGYTSDEKGIRHALIDDANANVDETDALFMIGACAAFVSYLINKSRAAGLLK